MQFFGYGKLEGYMSLLLHVHDYLSYHLLSFTKKKNNNKNPEMSSFEIPISMTSTELEKMEVIASLTIKRDFEGRG